MKKQLVALGLLISSTSLYAVEYAGMLSINRIRMHEANVLFGVSPQPNNTCSSWGESMKFEHATMPGKNFLSMLLTAKAAGKKIDLWYTASATPGADQTNGCTENNVSRVTGIAVR